METTPANFHCCRDCTHVQINKLVQQDLPVCCNKTRFHKQRSYAKSFGGVFCSNVYRTSDASDACVAQTSCKDYRNFQCNFLRLLLYFITLISAITFTSALPRLCTDPEAIDLLAHALSDAHRLPMGVEIVKDENNIKGYRFDTFARLLGVDSKVIFPYCNKFPLEFSIILTFQHRVKRSTNEFILTLLGQDKRTILLSVRLQRDRIVFDYLTKSNTKISTSFKNTAFTDGRWHTLLITVTLDKVKFTLDCGTPVISKLHTPFPKKMNIKKTRIYVASRRIKLKRFTGLLRQLILLPGADAAVKMCPSERPALATLNDHLLSNNLPKETHYSNVIFEEDFPRISCTLKSKGSMLYTKEKQMQICTGNTFAPIRGGKERMDYVVDFEDIITKNYTLSMEQFTIPGEGYFIATANNDDLVKNVSHIFRWNGKEFVIFQSVKTQSAMVWKYFEIGYEYFLAVANYGGSHVQSVMSVIYRWSRRDGRFLKHQILQTNMARSLEIFSIDMMYFLIIATQRNFGSGASGPINNTSIIYKWSPDQRRFLFYDFLPTVGALDITFFRIALSPGIVLGNCVAVANAFDGQTSRVSSEIYCWQPESGSFLPMQAIETVGAADWEFFEFDNRYFLAVANNFDQTQNYGPFRTLNSTIYELNLDTVQFIQFQQIETHGANDWEFFTIGNQYFLIVSNSVSATSDIYRWKGIEKFVKVHSLPIGAMTDFDYISINGEHYLASANAEGTFSKLFKIVTY